MAAWAQLFAAGVLEVVMAFALKASAGGGIAGFKILEHA